MVMLMNLEDNGYVLEVGILSKLFCFLIKKSLGLM